jgi:hypothetical protein
MMKMRFNKFSIFSFLLIAILILSLSCLASNTTPVTAEGNVYYVAKNGSDKNPGTSDSPWLTIQYAAETMVAGDKVLIREGTYHEHVYTVHSGNADNYIIFSAYPGETPIIDGSGVTESQNGFIIDQSFIKLIGLEICNWEENAIWIENAGYIEISDCEIQDVCYGIGVADGTHHFEFNRVVVHNFDLYGFDVSPSGGAGCHNGTFNDCISHSGRDAEQNVDGFALGHGTQHDFVLNRCEAYQVFDGFDISARNTTLNRCSAHDCSNGGYKLWQDEVTLLNCLGYRNDISNVELDWDEEPGTTILQNCTFVDAQTYNVWVENAADSLYMYNCILAGGDNIGLAFEQMNTSNYKGDYNLFHNNAPNRTIVVGYTDEFSLTRLDEWQAYSGQDAHSLVAHSVSDIFVDPIYSNYHLSETSPAVDHGTEASAPSEDYEGKSRPQGERYDMGAYER